MSGYINGAIGCKNSVIGASSNWRGNSCSFSMPAASWIATYPNPGATSGYKFNYGAPYPDGTFYLTNSYDNDEAYDVNSLLLRVSDGAALTSTGAPTNAVTPAFSHDGRAVAYNQRISTTGASSGTQLRVRDFSCGAAAGSTTCVGTSRTFSSERTVANCGTTGCQTIGHPSFLPDNAGILYQHVVREPGLNSSPFSNTSFSRLNTWYGALGEVWLTSKNTGFTPIRLNALNGRTSGGTSYLPTVPRDVSTPTNYDTRFHAASGTTMAGQPPYWVGDKCSPGPQSTSVVESQLNYIPTASPQEAGDKYWVIFTSRRLYGNVAISSPWQTQRSNGSDFYAPFGGACSGYDAYGPASGFIETKKLWVSAIDKTWSSGGDPSHPPFYLRGQELEAGNSHGHWVETPCAGLNASCVTHDDCCFGTGATPTTECRIVSTGGAKECRNASSCAAAGVTCATTADCCSGLQCPMGGGVCIAPPPPVVVVPVYAAGTTTREFIASCPAGTSVAWRFFEWQATVPNMTTVDFFVQTKDSASATYEPMMPLLLSSATPASGTGPGTWYRGPQTVDQVLAAAMPPLPSRSYLLVTMAFNPITSVSPTLHEWRQIYDCLPSE
jgi:hypothetical protein